MREERTLIWGDGRWESRGRAAEDRQTATGRSDGSWCEQGKLSDSGATSKGEGGGISSHPRRCQKCQPRKKAMTSKGFKTIAQHYCETRSTTTACSRQMATAMSTEERQRSLTACPCPIVVPPPVHRPVHLRSSTLHYPWPLIVSHAPLELAMQL